MGAKKTIKINLLRPDRGKIIRRTIMAASLFLTLLFGGFLFWQYNVAANEYAAEENQLAVFTAQLENEQAVQEILAENERLAALLQEKKRLIAELSQKQVSFISLLKTIEKTTPQTVFIETLEIRDKELFLGGYIFEPDDFVHFLNRLDKSLLIEDIKDFSSTREKNAGVFTIDMEWKAEKR